MGHIYEQSAIYAIGHNRPNANITVGELQAFIGILVITKYDYHVILEIYGVGMRTFATT